MFDGDEDNATTDALFVLLYPPLSEYGRFHKYISVFVSIYYYFYLNFYTLYK
jgi:hypothetical protein